jgi:transcriptional antiterminator RfaH
VTTWHAVHSHPHAEEKAAFNLARQGFEVILPRQRRWVRHARKRMIVRRPLFPRYLFVCLDRDATGWRPILSTLGVAGMVCAGDRPAVVPAPVIDSLRRREADGAFDFIATQRLQPGDRVRIAEGPLENVIGRLLASGDDERVTILFELLGRIVRAEVSTAAIEAA